MSIPHSYRQMPGTCIYVCECICVFTYHCLIVEGRRRCLRGPALSGPSGPVRPVCPVRALGPRALERTGRTGPDRTGQGRHRALAKSSLALSGPVRSVRSAPVPWAQDARTGRTGPDRTGPQITSSLFFLFEKRWSGAPKQAFGPKVMECCSKTIFWTKSDGVLLQN